MENRLLILFLFLGQHLFSQNISRSEYIERYKGEAIFQMKKYNIPASITLAQAILESADGNSELAKKSNNHFGIKCHSNWEGEKVFHDDDESDECFRAYKNVEESFEDHSKFLLKERYSDLFKLNIDDYKSWAKGLKKAGYATNPDYAKHLIRIIEDNNLSQFDKEIDLVPSNSESKKENFEQSVKDVLNQSEKSGQTCFQFRSAALLRTASQTRCVSCASRKFGCASSPVWRACKKSATW